ncbi:uncharacterized protein LOC141538199 [Cotesia typhae]|uniref:uncharacterized protein LOC141538199 n=1 Tax=Cotesia typhae TaxID=2053667 RepID=UPI003D69AA23
MIDKEVFELFTNNSFIITTNDPASKSTVTSNTVTSTSAKNDDISEVPLKKVKSNEFDLDQVLENSSVGSIILEEYAKQQASLPQSRITLVPLYADALKGPYRKYPSKQHKIYCAKEIIRVFLNLKDKYTLEGWVNKSYY